MLSAKHELNVEKIVYVPEWNRYYKIESLLGKDGDKLYFITTTTYETTEDGKIFKELDKTNYTQTEIFSLSELGEKFRNLCLDLLPETLNGDDYYVENEFDEFKKISYPEIQDYHKKLNLKSEVDLQKGELRVYVKSHTKENLNKKILYNLYLECIKVGKDYYVLNDNVDIEGLWDDGFSDGVTSFNIESQITTENKTLRNFSKNQLIMLGEEVMRNFTKSLFEKFVEDY